MATPTAVWGIDLGQCALKAIRLQEVNGQITATAFDYVEHPKILSQPDADPDALTREALEKFLSRNSIRGDFVAISVPGQSGLARFVKLPPVEEKKIVDIVRFEAKQQIPFNLDEVVWDFQKISQGAVTDGFAMETEIGLFAMKRDMVNRYIQHFKDVRIEIHLIQMAPLALCNFVAYDLLKRNPDGSVEGEAKEGAAEGEGEEAPERKTNCVVALDIGADSSNLVITDGDRIIWQRPIPLGGNHFTRALTKDLKLTFAKAEHVKRNATKSPDLKKILTSLRPVLNDFVSEVQRSLAFFTNTHRDATVDYMVGLGNAFRLPGLQKYLAEKLQLDVRKLGKMERLQGDTVISQQVYSENIMSFAVAYGLGLQGLERARLITNLLPHEIRFERLVRAKKPWAVGAAAALLLGCGALTAGYYLEDRPYNHPRITAAIKSSGDLVTAVGAAKAKFEKAKKDALDEEQAVKSIVAGQMERRNWLQLLKFIDTAVAKPDGSNWVDARKKQNYLEGRGAKAAEQFKAMLAGTTVKLDDAAIKDRLPPFVDDLVLFNIEAIDCRFTDNLQAQWSVSKTNSGEEIEDWRPMTDFNNAPEGRGWVVEVRGYTFHKEGRRVIRDVLLENLARMGSPAAFAEAAPAGGEKKEPPAGEKKEPAGGKPPSSAPAAPPASKPAPAEAAPKPTAPAAAATKPATPAAPGTKPATPGAAAPGGAAATPDPTAPPEDLVVGRVSHFVFLSSNTVAAAGGGVGGPSLLNSVARGGAPAGGSIKPTGGAPPGGGAAMGAPQPPSGGGGSTWSPLIKGPYNPSVSGGRHKRTDFTIEFFWREWTPSDQLRGMAGEAPPSGKK
jgi:type IV pilus assembly protein PilM